MSFFFSSKFGFMCLLSIVGIFLFQVASLSLFYSLLMATLLMKNQCLIV